LTQQVPPPPSPKSSSRNRSVLIAVLVIGLVIGLVLGIFVSVLFNLPSLFHTGVGVNNQVQVSGTVPDNIAGTLYFFNSNRTFETSAPINNGRYSVLLVGGQSYDIFDYVSLTGPTGFSDYNPFYVPLGIITLTENLMLIK
jgi:hypothetical protein